MLPAERPVMNSASIPILQGQHVVLGVCGSIACYKAVDLASKLTQAGALVDIILTEAATHFVSALTFQSVTGRAVYTDLWAAPRDATGLPTHVAHVGLAESADLILIAPATADALARMAGGFASDLLSITAMAAACPVVIAPAMDGGMYESAAVRTNVLLLETRGFQIVQPEYGRFASGFEGRGRLPETGVLLSAARNALGRVNGLLRGRQVVVTAGGTREPIDPVRFIGNRSSGKQGFALARAALDAGAEVTLISAHTSLEPPHGAAVIPVETAAEMRDAVLSAARQTDALVMAAAVADFRPAQIAAHKIKKSRDNQDGLSLNLTRTDDILLAVRSQRELSGFPRVVIGFAAESDHILDNARVKLERKALDLMVANDISAIDAGFEVETNRVTLLDAAGIVEPLERMSKQAVAETIIERLAALLA